MINAKNVLALQMAMKKLDKDRPAAGNYKVGLTVQFDDGESFRADGDMRQGEDYEQAVWHTVPWQTMCSVLFSKVNGVTMEAVIRESFSMIENGDFPGYVANPNDIDPETGKAKVMRIKDAASAAVKCLTQATTKTFKGKSTSKVKIEKLT